MTETSFPSSPLAHWNITTHFMYSGVLSEMSGHQSKCGINSVNVEYRHLQTQFTPTEILKLFILFLFSSSFCLKCSLHFMGRVNISQVNPVKSRLLARDRIRCYQNGPVVY